MSNSLPPDALALMEAEAIWDDVRQHDRWDDQVTFKTAAVILWLQLRDRSFGAVAELSPDEDMTGPKLIWDYWNHQKQECYSEESAARSLLDELKSWHHTMTGRRWGKWRPPTLPTNAAVSTGGSPTPAAGTPHRREEPREERAGVFPPAAASTTTVVQPTSVAVETPANGADCFSGAAEEESQIEEPTAPPAALVNKTYGEAKLNSMAIAAGPSGENWRFSSENPMLAAYDPARNWASPVILNLTNSEFIQGRTARSVLGNLGTRAVLAYKVLLSWIGELRGEGLILDPDDLIKRLCWEPRNEEERDEMKRRLWRWITAFCHLYIERDASRDWRNSNRKDYRGAIERVWLLHLDSVVYRPGDCEGEGGVPIRFRISPGDWLKKAMMREDCRRMLQDFGDLGQLTAIPGGQPSGRWAQVLGLTLFQLWRERCGAAKSRYPQGRFRFTRQELLSMFSLRAEAEELLNGNDPQRAREYWSGAIERLKAAGVIGEYGELGTISKGRVRWKRDWLGQALEIAPTDRALCELSKLGSRAAWHRKENAALGGGT